MCSVRLCIKFQVLYYKMIRLLIIVAIIQSSVSQSDDADLEDIINQIFGIDSEADEKHVPNCSGLDGRGVGCYECYFCNNSLVQENRFRGRITKLELRDSKCSSTEVCCVIQPDLVNLRQGDECGKCNPDGIPRKRRPAVRAVLQGEFPWRAWVYKKKAQTPLCAATFIHEDTKALLALASCLQGLSADSVEVAFVKGGPRSAVDTIITHEKYRAGEATSNIAIVRVRSLQSAPRWASPACLPLAPPTHAAPCLTTSHTDIRINTVIPLPKLCSGGAPLDKALMCAVAPLGDYQPEKGAGLYCQELHATRPAYIMQGIYVSTTNSTDTYVKTWEFKDWIDKKLELN